MRKTKWLAEQLAGLPAVLLLAAGVTVALLLAGCVGRVQFDGLVDLCKPSELRSCNPEPLPIPQ